jgi:antitoxin (DNA-binding transcriptional repressor) of toxin-antitoxin stability system
VVGAEEFGLHAPRYSQRAAAGESFLITRRGRPMARLIPPGEPTQLGLADLTAPRPPPRPAPVALAAPSAAALGRASR